MDYEDTLSHWQSYQCAERQWNYTKYKRLWSVAGNQMIAFVITSQFCSAASACSVLTFTLIVFLHTRKYKLSLDCNGFFFFFFAFSALCFCVYSTYTHAPSAAFLLSSPLLLSHIKLRCNVKEMKKKCEESGKEERERPLRGKERKTEWREASLEPLSIQRPLRHSKSGKNTAARQAHFLFFWLSGFAVAIFFCLPSLSCCLLC